MALEKAINRFFDAALNPDDWPSALDDVAAALGAGAGGATLVIGASSRPSLVESTSIKPAVAEYFRHGAPIDPRENRVRPRVSEGFVADYHDFTPEEIERDPFYQEFLRTVGLGWHAVACLADGPDDVVLSLKRPWSQGHYDGNEIAALDKVLPHLRAAALAARQAWGMALDDQLATIDRVGHGALLIDRHGRPTTISASVGLGDGLSVFAGALRAAFAADQAGLDLVVAVATAAAPPAALPPPPAVALRRPSGKRPLVVRGLPLDAARRSLLAPAVAMLLVDDLDLRPSVPADVARAVFALTPKEAELAARLAAGDTVEEAADAVAISKAHARQRLKIIFEKTDTRRQSELIAVMLKLGR